MNRNIIRTLVVTIFLSCANTALAYWWMPTLPIYPYEPTECDVTKVGIYIVGCIESIKPDISGNDITVSIIDYNYCTATQPAGPYLIELGKLAPGLYHLTFKRNGELMTNNDVPYEKWFNVVSADCSKAVSEVLLPEFNLQYSGIKTYLPDVLTISGLSVSGASNTYWGAFQWNPNKLSFEIISAGDDPPY